MHWSTPARPLLVSLSVYPVPLLLIDSPVNVTYPLFALTEVVPLSLAPVGLFAKAIVTVLFDEVTMLPITRPSIASTSPNGRNSRQHSMVAV